MGTDAAPMLNSMALIRMVAVPLRTTDACTIDVSRCTAPWVDQALPLQRRMISLPCQRPLNHARRSRPLRGQTDCQNCQFVWTSRVIACAPRLRREGPEATG